MITITYQAYAAHSKKELNKNRTYTAENRKYLVVRNMKDVILLYTHVILQL